MGEEHLSVPASYKYKKGDEYIPGVITMTERNFTFTPNNSRFLSIHKIHVDIGKITVQYGTIKAKEYKVGKTMMRITVNDSTNKVIYIFELENSDGDSCRAHTKKYVGKEPEGTVVYLAEIQQKILVLQKNLEQRRLHEQLVRGNILKEDEFWAKRKKLLQAVACEPTNQQTGLKSAMTSYIQLMSGEHTKTVQMNSEIIQQVFTEKPVVLREFLKKVPDKINETDFWSKFFTAEGYRRKDKIALGRAEASADRQLAIFLEDDDIVADEVQHKIGNVDPTIDMVADYSDDHTHLRGHVAVVTDKLETALLHDINRHAVIVLEGRVIDSKLHDAMDIAKAADKIKKAKKNTKIVDERIRIQKVNKMVEIDDLRAPPNFHIPLHVKEDTTVDADVGNMDVDIDNVYADLEERSLNITKKGLNNPVIKSDLTLEVINQCNYITKSQINNTPKTSVLESLSQDIKESISEHWAIILELLWHFWASYPPTNELLNTKVNQLKDSIAQRYNQLQEIIKPLQSDVGHQLSLLLQPMLQAIGEAT